ncbi:tetratricopeptide repeat protein [Orbaceae bacterium ac157xtp]
MKKLSYLLLPLSFLFLSGFTIDIPECDHDKDEYNLEQCKSLADSGDPKAMFYMGYLYDEGEDVKQSFGLAAYWYENAARKGYSQAQLNLGFLYSVGDGVEQSDEKAFEWYLKAAEQGEVDAQFNIGKSYQNGYGVDIDLKKAAEWFKLAADQGDEEAQAIYEELSKK